ncbi:MAG: sigma-70 family RNA polymerase sigma factor [Anaerolineae bacterium]
MSAVPTRTNEEWLEVLQTPGPEQTQALEELRDYLLRAVYVYLSRHRSDLMHFDRDEIQQLAEDWAQEALLTILAKLDTFRGDSRFTTWAYRVVINLAASELRRRRWANLSLEGLTENDEDEDSGSFEFAQESSGNNPESALQQRHVWDTLQHIIEQDLTERQRAVLVGSLVEGKPVEALAAQLSTNPNNIYKIMHDARKKLKQRLADYNLNEDSVLQVFAGT